MGSIGRLSSGGEPWAEAVAPGQDRPPQAVATPAVAEAGSPSVPPPRLCRLTHRWTKATCVEHTPQYCPIRHGLRSIETEQMEKLHAWQQQAPSIQTGVLVESGWLLNSPRGDHVGEYHRTWHAKPGICTTPRTTKVCAIGNREIIELLLLW